MIFSSKNRKIGSFAMDCIKFWAANTILSILSLAGEGTREYGQNRVASPRRDTLYVFIDHKQTSSVISNEIFFTTQNIQFDRICRQLRLEQSDTGFCRTDF